MYMTMLLHHISHLLLFRKSQNTRILDHRYMNSVFSARANAPAVVHVSAAAASAGCHEPAEGATRGKDTHPAGRHKDAAAGAA